MKTKLFLLTIIFGISSSIFAQYTKSIVSSTNTNGASGILDKDIDDDGDIDLIGCSVGSNTVSYFINDGTGVFTQFIIDNALTGATFADSYDLEGDGDLDFIAIGSAELVWYENDGTFNFTRHSIANLTNATYVRVYDIDDDNDGDIGVAVFGENQLTAFQNNGSASFTRLNLISINTPKIFHGGDFNGNNDGDVLISSFAGNEIAWYYWSVYRFVRGGTVSASFAGATGVEGGDVDGDGDDDVIGAAYTDNEIAWFENTDGTGSSSSFTKHTIDNNFVGASYVHLIDIDNDGDKDIVATAYGNGASGNEVAIYTNDGSQNFTKNVVDNTEQGANFFAVADFDGNNSLDIAYSAGLSSKFVLLKENTSAVVQRNNTFSFYPNPAHNVVNIQSDDEIQKVTIYDITGRIVLQSNNKNINLENLSSGQFMLQVKFKNGKIATRKLLIN